VEFGAFTSGLLTGLREGVEAVLIVSIVLAYLAKTGNARHFGRIWLGVTTAVAVSLVAGVAIFASVGALEEPYEQIFEGATLLLATAVVTWMLFWMRRQSASVSGELRAAVDRALTEGSLWALTGLAFVAVIREGIETSLFLVGQASAAGQGTETGAASVLLGALAGLLVAVVLGAGFYQGTRRINLGAFFRWTGIGLIFIAAGLLSVAIHEFIEIGAIAIGTGTVYDLSAVLPHREGIGQFLRALLGYSSKPEATTLAVHVAYLVVILGLYLRPVKPAAPRPSPTPAGVTES
jgi:high-affinity iron transporter